MRYVEDRERSAEILRLTLRFMGRQRAGFNPHSFTLWYEHCAGLNSELSRVLESRLATQSQLTDEEVSRLYEEHILERDIRQYESLRHEFCRILTDTAADTEVASEQASDFDRALVGHAEQLAANQTPQTVSETVTDLRTQTGKMRAMAADFTEKLNARTQQVSQLTEELQRARSEALFDVLTGVMNRRGFDREVQRLESERRGLAGSSLLMVDIDHFKSVNDRHGHLLGDKVIHAVAHVIRTNIKVCDLPARIGGEEFVVLLPDTPLAGALTLAQRIASIVGRGRLKRPDGQGPIGQVTVSIGIAAAHAGDSLETLLARADAALFRAKRAGRNRIEVHSPEVP